MPQLGVVLDTAALLAFANGGERVGMMVAHLADLGESVLVPATCLATAYRHADDAGWGLLDLLAGHPHVEVAPLERRHCAILGDWARVLGLELAHAAVESAYEPVTPLMTDRRALLNRILPREWPIIDI